MSIYNNKHVVFEQVGVDSDTVVWNQSTNTDDDGAYNDYEISNIRNTVLPTKALALSSELYATLTNTTIQTAKNGNSNTLVSTSDKTFILAEKEMNSGERRQSVEQEFNTLTTLSYWTTHTTNEDRKKYDSSSTVRAYWLRSPRLTDKRQAVDVYTNGGISYEFAYATYNVAQCFAY